MKHSKLTMDQSAMDRSAKSFHCNGVLQYLAMLHHFFKMNNINTYHPMTYLLCWHFMLSLPSPYFPTLLYTYFLLYLLCDLLVSKKVPSFLAIFYVRLVIYQLFLMKHCTMHVWLSVPVCLCTCLVRAALSEGFHHLLLTSVLVLHCVNCYQRKDQSAVYNSLRWIIAFMLSGYMTMYLIELATR